MNQRDRLVQRIARSLSWADRTTSDKDAYRYRASRVVDDLLEGPAEGKAVERALKVINKDEQVA